MKVSFAKSAYHGMENAQIVEHGKARASIHVCSFLYNIVYRLLGSKDEVVAAECRQEHEVTVTLYE
jgi:hypothetical protein